MPVIGGVVSLASTLPGNTALTGIYFSCLYFFLQCKKMCVLIKCIFFAGALPTSNASSKNIGEVSTGAHMYIVLQNV